MNATATNYNALYGTEVNITGGEVTATASSTNGYGYDIYGFSGVNISGGQVTANGRGIQSNANINIGYTSETDSITAASFTGTVTVKDNCWFTDGENMYSGTLTDDQKKAIAGKKLTTKICNVKVDGSNVTADKTGSILYGQTVTLTYTGSAKAGYEIFFTVNNTEIDGESFMVTEDSTVNVKVTATSLQHRV